MPIVIFAFLFGISMDYQVFILSRMREAYDRTGSTDAAVVEGIGRTGRLVTSAALILGLAFVAMSASPGTEAKTFATALGGGILLDATLIRGVLAPAAVALLGRSDRMREAYDRTGSTDAAVVEGIGRTGRLVTSAALILGLAFVAMSASPGTEAKTFATALGGGILLDATLIRGVLAPAAVALLGRWNWWMPRRAARVMRIAPESEPEPVS